MRKISNYFALISLLSLIPLAGADEALFKEIRLCCAESVSASAPCVDTGTIPSGKRSVVKKSARSEFVLFSYLLIDQKFSVEKDLFGLVLFSPNRFLPSSNTIRAPPVTA